MEDSDEKTTLLAPANLQINYTVSDQSLSRNGQTVNVERILTADDILNFAGYGPFQVLAFILTGFTYFAFGLDVSVLTLIGAPVRHHFNLTETQYTILPAVTGIPNIFGALVFSFLLDRFGRVWPYALCLFWIGAASIASAFANSFPLLVCLKCVVSVAFGGIPALTFPTIVEFLPVRNRGKVTLLVSVLMLLGVCGSYGMGWWLIPGYEDGWRYYMAAVSIPIFFVAFYRIIFHFESPRYLISRGRKEQAWKIFSIIAKLNFKNLTDFISKEQFISQLETTNKEEKLDIQEHKPRRSLLLQFLAIFTPRYLRRTLPLSILIITETIGYLCSKVFMPDYLTNLGVSVYFTLVTASLAEIPGVLLMSIIVEWRGVGRLNSMRFFSALTSLMFIILTILVVVEGHQSESIYLPVMFILIYFSAFPVMGLIYTYVSESYPTSIRSVSTAYFFILQSLAFLGGSYLTSSLAIEGVHWLFPLVWAGIFLIQLVAGMVLNYEPFGKKLKDIVDK